MTSEELTQNGGNSKISARSIHHSKIVWMHYANFFIGFFLVINPFTFGYSNQPGGINDSICGLLVCTFSLLSVSPERSWAPWGAAITGLWLNVAPLVFWADQAVIYNTDTLTGIFIIAFAIVAPGIPGSRSSGARTDIPEGWSHNPSSWTQRIPIIFIGWIGFFASRYLAAYQLEYIASAPDPFFDNGTENVLNSDISKAWPVSDAGLGAFSYMLDAMMGYLGGENRWRAMPWVVILFGILIIPLGAVSIGLIILQPIAVGSWCSICLFTALVMLIMIPCTFDEVFASIGFLRDSKKKGKSFWRTLFSGDDTTSPYTAPQKGFSSSPKQIIREIFSEMAIPWNLIASCIIGTWLMFSPSVFGYENLMADSDHLAGALIITFAVIAMGEIVRVVRLINIPIGLWIISAPFVLGYSTKAALYNAVICGALLILFSIRKGNITNSYGYYNRYII